MSRDDFREANAITHPAFAAGLAIILLSGCAPPPGPDARPRALGAEVVFSTNREIEVALPPGGTIQQARDAARPYCSPLRGRLSPGRTLATGNILFRCDPL